MKYCKDWIISSKHSSLQSFPTATYSSILPVIVCIIYSTSLLKTQSKHEKFTETYSLWHNPKMLLVGLVLPCFLRILNHLN